MIFPSTLLQNGLDARAEEGRANIGVAEGLSRHRNLFSCLEGLLPVKFYATSEKPYDTLSAVLALSQDGAHQLQNVPPHLSRFTVVHDHESLTSTGAVLFADSDCLPRCLRGKTMSDEAACGVGSVSDTAGSMTMASCAGEPIWVRQIDGNTVQDRVACAPVEVAASELLRDHLYCGRFISLLPLVDFLRHVAEQVVPCWTPPPLRACIVIDDPNLHTTSYGHIRFAELARDADIHNYHVSMATVPLDAWRVSSKAADIFRATNRLSLCVHGNDHRFCELGQAIDFEAYVQLLMQAQRRTARLESKAQLTVDRVMVAPHGAYHDLALQALLHTGFVGALASLRQGWQTHRRIDSPLCCARLADIHSGSVPVVTRKRMNEHDDTLALSAFLHTPLVVFGHHQDAARDYELFRHNAQLINSLGDVRWSGIGDLLAENYFTYVQEDELHIKPYALHCRVKIPEGVNHLVLDTSGLPIPPDQLTMRIAGNTVRMIGKELNESISVPVGGKEVVDVQVMPPAHADDHKPSPRSRVWPLVRRLLAEARDRLTPLRG